MFLGFGGLFEARWRAVYSVCLSTRPYGRSLPTAHVGITPPWPTRHPQAAFVCWCADFDQLLLITAFPTTKISAAKLRRHPSNFQIGAPTNSRVCTSHNSIKSEAGKQAGNNNSRIIMHPLIRRSAYPPGQFDVSGSCDFLLSWWGPREVGLGRLCRKGHSSSYMPSRPGKAQAFTHPVGACLPDPAAPRHRPHIRFRNPGHGIVLPVCAGFQSGFWPQSGSWLLASGLQSRQAWPFTFTMPLRLARPKHSCLLGLTETERCNIAFLSLRTWATEAPFPTCPKHLKAGC